MHYFRVNSDWLFRSGIVLFFVLGANGCGHEAREAKESSDGYTIKCEDKVVNVDPTAAAGTRPTAVYLCHDRKVTWKDNGHTFKVEFKGDSPFVDDDKAFHNTHATSNGMKRLNDWTVFEYKITVDGKVFDPQVIGGGGN